MSIEHQLSVLMNETQMSGERTQCGLTSLLPMSCRGRAEAFARRLHTRLRNLGNGNPSDPAETRWLGSASAPRRDSDLFFDFELECESPPSPVDEYDAPFQDCATVDEGEAPFYEVDHEPDRDNQPRAKQNDSGCIPNGETSSPNRVNGFNFSSAFYTDRSPIKTQPAPRENGHGDGRLYSAITFDDCERHEPQHKPLIDEVDAAALRLLPSHPQLSAADSDSEFESAKSDLITDETFESTEIQKLEEDNSLASDRLSELSLHLEDPSAESNHIEIVPIQIQDKVDDRNEISCSNGEEISSALEIKTDEVSSINDVSLTSEQDSTLSQKESKIETEEDDRPQRVRRCSSLKTGKTPPGTPGHKKIVRFADVLGLDLADVKTFMDDIPVIPKSAYEDLANADLAIGSPPTRPPMQRPGGTGGSLSLVPLFQTVRDITESLEARCVCLESARVAEGPNTTVYGSVRVRNLDFHKTVHVRYTMDYWRTYTDVQATYVPGSCDGFSDRFTFLIYVPTISAGQRLELAVRFQCKGCQYWDNNFGVNYCFDCLPLGVPSVASINCSPLHPTRDWHPSFY